MKIQQDLIFEHFKVTILKSKRLAQSFHEKCFLDLFIRLRIIIRKGKMKEFLFCATLYTDRFHE